MEVVLIVIEALGVLAFSIQGALAAINREADLFGVLFLSFITTFGGGATRDLLIGNIPPVVFSSGINLVVCFSVSLLVFLAALIFKERFVENEELIDSLDNIVDCVGLGTFAVSGTIICLNTLGLDCSPFTAIFMGMTSCIGGSIMRDLIIGAHPPAVFRKRIYAVAAIAGSATFYILYVTIGIPEIVATVIGIATVFIIRILATFFRWKLPRAIVFSEIKERVRPRPAKENLDEILVAEPAKEEEQGTPGDETEPETVKK